MPIDRSEPLTGTEALMWRIGQEPMLGSAFANIMVFDRPPDPLRVRSRLSAAARDFARLRQHVQSQPLTPPVWVDEGDGLDLDYHVRHLAMPAPATRRHLLDMASRWAQDPFDPSRPLWQVGVVEGLRGGRGALLAKLHHAVTDGLGALAIAGSLSDAERSPGSEPGARSAEVPEERPPRSGPAGDIASHLSVLARSALESGGLVTSAARTIARIATSPGEIEREALRAAGAAKSLARQVGVTDSGRSPLWSGRRSLHRRIEALDVSLTRTKRAARSLGGTVNDAFVTAVAGGAAEYHRRMGSGVDELRISMPVYLRAPGAPGSGNSFSPARVLVPAGIADPARRFAEIHQRLAAARSEPALGLTARIADALAAVPDPLLALLAHQQVESVDFAASNLFGVPGTVYVAGAQLLADFPVGPTMGVAFNATTISYRSRLFVGLNIDSGTVDDPGRLRDCVVASFRELLGSAAAR